jgi:hypothetical protein
MRSQPGPFSPATSLPVLLLPLTLFLNACGQGPSSDIHTEVRDSAGITVVESNGLPEHGANGWTLGQNPDLSIGTLDGDSLYQLFRVSGGVLLDDGRMVISENGRLQLRVFGADGVFQASFGREGEGPGEFTFIRILGVLGTDTLVALDGNQRRISRFHLTDGFLDQALVDDEAGVAHFSNGMFSDGSVVFGGGLVFGPGGPTPSDGYQRTTTDFQAVTPDGSISHSFGEFPGSELFFRTQSGSGERMISASVIHMGKVTRAHARDHRLVVGTGDSFEIQLFEPGGALTHLIRAQAPQVPVTSAILDGLLEERIADLDDPSMAPATRTSFQDVPAADFVPAFQNLFLDSEGFLWVEHMRLPGERLTTWTVFDDEGLPITQLSLPRQNRILDIGRDRVLALFEDELGVEYLRVYPLSRGG